MWLTCQCAKALVAFEIALVAQAFSLPPTALHDVLSDFEFDASGETPTATLAPTSTPSHTQQHASPMVSPTSALGTGLRTAPLYAVRDVGNCNGVGLDYVGSFAECETAARYVGGTNITASQYNFPTNPHGCYFSPADQHFQGVHHYFYNANGDREYAGAPLSVICRRSIEDLTTMAPPTLAPTLALPATRDPSASRTASPTASQPTASPHHMVSHTTRPTTSGPSASTTASPDASQPTASPTIAPTFPPTTANPTTNPTQSPVTPEPTPSPTPTPTTTDPTPAPIQAPTPGPTENALEVTGYQRVAGAWGGSCFTGGSAFTESQGNAGDPGGVRTVEFCAGLCNADAACAGFDRMDNGWECRGNYAITGTCPSNSLYSVYIKQQSPATANPTINPTANPTANPTMNPTANANPTANPTVAPGDCTPECSDGQACVAMRVLPARSDARERNPVQYRCQDRPPATSVIVPTVRIPTTPRASVQTRSVSTFSPTSVPATRPASTYSPTAEFEAPTGSPTTRAEFQRSKREEDASGSSETTVIILVVVGLLAFIAAITGVTAVALRRRTQSAPRDGAFANPIYESHPVFGQFIQDGHAGESEADDC